MKGELKVEFDEEDFVCMYQGKISRFGQSSGHIIVPKKYLNKSVIVIVLADEITKKLKINK